MIAICINCGAKKSLPYERCSQCTFDPRLDRDDLVKSVYLSSGRFDLKEEKQEYESVLDTYAERLRSGLDIEYDQTEIERLQVQLAEVEAVDDKSILNYLFKVFFPGVVFLLILITVLIALKQL